MIHLYIYNKINMKVHRKKSILQQQQFKSTTTTTRSYLLYFMVAILTICICLFELWYSQFMVNVVITTTNNNNNDNYNNNNDNQMKLHLYKSKVTNTISTKRIQQHVTTKKNITIKEKRNYPTKKITTKKKNNQQRITQIDSFCPYCRFSYVNQNKGTLTCGKKILMDANLNINTNTTAVNVIENNPSFRQAAVSIANNENQYGSCRRCDPASCSLKDKVYYRIDDVAPSEVTAITYYLQSIPTKHRIPPSVLNNLTSYVSNTTNVYPARQYFFEFNPSIVQLPKSQRFVPDAIYLASFRVSTCHDCVPNPNDYIKLMNGPRSTVTHTEYLGLALMNKYMKIVQEIVVKMQPHMKRFQDPRLFVINEQLYVGSYHHIRPIWLVYNKIDSNNMVVPLTHVWPNAEISKYRIISKIYLGTHGTSICTKDMKSQNTAKNLNYFVDANNDTILEFKPMGPYERMNMSVPCDTKAKTEATFIQDKSAKPFPSFGTTDELDLSKQQYYDAYVTDDRGSACCTTIRHPDGRMLRLGISHSKTLFWNGQVKALKSNQFFSSFYAFEPNPPYKVVARTGRFCFGFPNESEVENPYTKMQVDIIKIINVEYTKCPRIHFVSGMVEKADDPTKLIIAYGVNDCVPRIVVIKKSDVVRMLFTPHEMINSL